MKTWIDSWSFHSAESFLHSTRSPAKLLRSGINNKRLTRASSLLSVICFSQKHPKITPAWSKVRLKRHGNAIMRFAIKANQINRSKFFNFRYLHLFPLFCYQHWFNFLHASLLMCVFNLWASENWQKNNKRGTKTFNDCKQLKRHNKNQLLIARWGQGLADDLMILWSSSKHMNRARL